MLIASPQIDMSSIVLFETSYNHDALAKVIDL